MKTSIEYIKALSESILALEAQKDALEKAAKIVADAQKEDKLIHVFGAETPASALISELFFRPGAPVNINPMLDPSLDIAHGAYRNAMCLELDGLAPCILDYYEYVSEGEPFILIGSDSGALMFTQALEWAKNKGLVTVAVAAAGCSCDADVVLNYEVGENGGAAALCALLKMLLIETAALLDKPEQQLWQGSHLAGAEENRQNIDRLLYRIRHL